MISRRPILRARIAGLVAALAVFACATAESAPVRPFETEAPQLPAARRAAPVVLADEPAVPLRRLTPRGETSADVASKSRLPSAGSVLSALAVVVLVIFGAARLWKSHGPKFAGPVPAAAAEVLGRCRIESRQSVYLVRLGSRVLVLGSSNGELSSLSEVTDPAEVDLIVAQCRSEKGTVSPFTRLFEARQREMRAAEQSAAEEEPRGNRWFRSSPEQRLAERVRGRGEETGRVA